MKKEQIDFLLKEGILRSLSKSKDEIKSLINSAQDNATTLLSLRLDEKTATIIFREMYESIRQLGEACWWKIGYKPQTHDISLEILKEIDIKNKVRLNFLDRFKQMRHDVNYRGFKVSVSQAQEIIELWKQCSKDIISFILKDL